MYDVKINVEVHCFRPPWGQYNPLSMFNDSKYRIYINQNLITERSWIWDNNIFLLENIWIHTIKNNEYILKLEPIVTVQEQAKFSLQNFKSDNSEITSKVINVLQINFTLQ